MEQLQLDDFLMYNFLSQVQISPDGKKVAYVATTPDLAKNGYNANLYRIDAESGKNVCLTNSGRVKGFCWQGEETLLYTVPVEADDAFPDGQTVLYRQNAGSAAEEVCRGEGSLSLEGVLTDGRIVKELDADATVSMNMWGLTPVFMETLEKGFVDFLSEIKEGDIKKEYLLPEMIDRLIKEGKAKVDVLETKDTWFGVTYQEDKAAVTEAFANLVKSGVYPSNLYK